MFIVDASVNFNPLTAFGKPDSLELLGQTQNRGNNT